jgi:hypothetical protein
MGDPELDRRLKAYLDLEERDRGLKRERDERIERAIQHVSDGQQLTDRKLDLFAVEVREQIKGIHSRMSKLEEDAEDTGVHDLAAIREREREAKEALKEQKEQKNRLLGWIIAAMGGVGLLLLSGGATVIWYLITHPVVNQIAPR